MDGEIDYIFGNWTKDPQKLYKQNFLPLLKETEKELTGWHERFLTWLSKCNAIKQNILPKIFDKITTQITRILLKKLQSEIIKFIWGYKPVRLHS